MGIHELGRTTTCTCDITTDHLTALLEPYSFSIYPGTGTVDGRTGDHVLLAPSYRATKEDVETIVGLTEKVIKEIFEKAMA